MIPLFNRRFHGIPLNRRNGPGNQAAGRTPGLSNDRTAAGRSRAGANPDSRLVDGLPCDGQGVEVGLQLLKVQREVEDVRICISRGGLSFC
jgi:hypothetical protein